MQKNYPSIKTLQLLGISKESAKLARIVLKAHNIESIELSKALKPIYEIYYNKIGKFMYNPHNLSELKMQLLNVICDSYGVEGIQDKNGYWLEYLNFGDTYDTTIIYYKNRFFVSSWGDVVESSMSLWD